MQNAHGGSMHVPPGVNEVIISKQCPPHPYGGRIHITCIVNPRIQSMRVPIRHVFKNKITLFFSKEPQSAVAPQLSKNPFLLRNAQRLIIMVGSPGSEEGGGQAVL